MNTKPKPKPAFPWMRDGTTGFFNDKNERVCTGSQMGRTDTMHPGNETEPLRLQRVPFTGTCYDRGGAYWGAPENLWCAWGDEIGDDGEQVEVWVRANSRAQAKAEILARFPDAKFIR